MSAKTVEYKPTSMPTVAWFTQVVEVEQAWEMWHAAMSVAPMRAAAQGAA